MVYGLWFRVLGSGGRGYEASTPYGAGVVVSTKASFGMETFCFFFITLKPIVE